MTMFVLPASIEAQVLDGEEADEFGEARLPSLVCTCGRRRRTEFFDSDLECYAAVDQASLEQWAAEHAGHESWADHDARLYAESVAVAVR